MSSKSKLLSAALEAVQHNGLKSLSFRTLGAEVGVKSSSVHYHFPEKSDLCDALVKSYRVGLSENLANMSKTNDSAYGAIQEFCHVFVALCKEQKLCLGAMLASEVESLSESNRESLMGMFNDIQIWLNTEFERGREELSTDLPNHVLTHCLLSALEGANLMDRHERGKQGLLDSVIALLDSWFVKADGLSHRVTGDRP